MVLKFTGRLVCFSAGDLSALSGQEGVAAPAILDTGEAHHWGASCLFQNILNSFSRC